MVFSLYGIVILVEHVDISLGSYFELYWTFLRQSHDRSLIFFKEDITSSTSNKKFLRSKPSRVCFLMKRFLVKGGGGYASNESIDLAKVRMILHSCFLICT